MSKQWLVYIGGLMFVGANMPAAAQATGDYAQDLARVYGAHQRVLAVREACDESFPDLRAATDKAYADWKKRNLSLLQDLERRVTMMIRQASKDQQEYSRNLGKYEGQILQQRLDFKNIVLALDKAEFEQQCRQFPAYLKGPEADFGKKYAEELQTLGRRK